MNNLLVKILLILMLMPLLSCKRQEKKQILSEEEMKKILMDMHISEAIAGRRGGLSVHRDMLRNDLMEDILEKYGISKETFFTSYQYYMEHPVELDSIYVQIIKVFEEKSDPGSDDDAYDSNSHPKSETLKDISTDQSAEKKE